MQYERLAEIVGGKKWNELEREWLAVIEKPGAQPDRLLPILETVVKSGPTGLAETLGWAWLSTIKETRTPREALQLGRGLLLYLPDGEQLRAEILTLYQQTHSDRKDLDGWIDRSGLKSGKSVRRALRYLDTGLRLSPGACLYHRTEDEACEVVSCDVESDTVTLRGPRRTKTLSVNEVIDDYDVVDSDDFRVLQQLHPDRIPKLMQEDPIRFVTGMVRHHRNQMDRDTMRALLVPRHVTAEAWSSWWTSLRNATKRNPQVRIEGRSPMRVIYEPGGRTVEQETWAAFSRATGPREWLEVMEGYLRNIKEQGAQPDAALVDRVQTALTAAIERFDKHREPAQEFATALVIERLAADGLPISADVHGIALRMLGESRTPAAMVAALPDQRLWALGVRCIEQCFQGEKRARVLAELILSAPMNQCDALARMIEAEGQGPLLVHAVEKMLSEPGRHTDAVVWLWKGPDVKTSLPIPPALELLNLILTLVGPARQSEGRATGQSVNEMRARVRAGLSAKSYARFRECVDTLDESIAATVRRQLERSEGLGPTVQDQMLDILRAAFPAMYVRKKVEIWDDESVLYFTEAGLKAKETERDELVNVKMRENAKAIGEAASHGDLSENSEYKFALEERDLLRARLAQLNSELSLARLIVPDDVPGDHVSIGHRVKLKPTNGSAPLEITILGASDSDLANHVYSYKTPIARRILGHRVGDSITLGIEGTDADYKIERFDNALARAVPAG